VFLGWGRFAAPARASDNPLQHAAKLRDDAAKDWNEKQYGAAVSKLRSALAIYAKTDGESPLDRAITERALVWNLVRVGDVEGARQALEALMDMVPTDESVRSEVNSAMTALWEAAASAPTLAEAVQVLEPVRAAAETRALPALEGQALHNLGSLAAKFKQTDLATGYYQRAVRVRRECGDAVGEAWSLNNLGNLYLTNGALPKALATLHEAFALVHRERVLPPQQAVAWNVKKAIETLRAAPGKDGARWLSTLSKISRESGFGAALPADYLDRVALDLTVRAGGKTGVLKAARALVKQPKQTAVPEIAADLTIRAARAACTLGKGKRASGWLKSLDLGQGPCRPHLAARWKTALALCAADKHGKKTFPAAAREAATAWRDLGDFRGRIDALAALAQAAEDAGLSDLIPALVKESAKASRQGGPGGDGGSAVSAGDRTRAADLALDAPLFRIRMDGEQIRIEDVAAEQVWKRKVRWKPGKMTANGLALTFFGGYVVVGPLNYGGSSVTGSTPGATTLDALARYVPIPAKDALVVQKNGALRYETGPVTGR